jgi:hypothetical protein
MEQATQLWTWWLSLLSPLAAFFTRPGGVRFVPWVTGMVLCGAEQTITQILTALGLESRGRVLEHFAEYEAWDRQAVERQTLRLFAQERPARWGRYHPIALDDTKSVEATAWRRATRAVIPASSFVTVQRSPVGRTAISSWAFATSIPKRVGVVTYSLLIGPALYDAGCMAPGAWRAISGGRLSRM